MIELPGRPPVDSSWSLLTESAPWPGRDSPGAVVFQDRTWLLGGFQSDTAGNFSRLRDVWSSPDGQVWDCVLKEAPWAARNVAGSVVFQNRIFILGGFDGVHTLSDVWSSPDGVDWDCQTEHAPWGARGAFGCTVYDGRIWVLGGFNWERKKHFGDVWSSADGVHWEQVARVADWGQRAMFPALAHDGAIWILGGGDYHDCALSYCDVWRSSDGARWEQVTDRAGWTPRRFHKAVVHADLLWVMGGAAVGSINLNDVWASSDGRDWTCTDGEAPWAIRHEFALLEFQGRPWLFGGFSGEIAGNVIYNDIWQMDISA